MRRSFLIGATAVAVAALALASVAPAQCNESLKVGTTLGWSAVAQDKSITGKGTARVVKNDGSYIEFEVSTDKGKMTMPGGIDAGRIIVTNPGNGNVWVASCTPTGFEGNSMLGGKTMKITGTVLKK